MDSNGELIPQFQEIGPLLIAGVSEAYTEASMSGIPAQWQRFVPLIGQIPGQLGGVTYGLVIPSAKPGEWDYVCGVGVAEGAPLLPGFRLIPLAKTRYAVFKHAGYLSTLRESWGSIWNKWLPESKLRLTRSARVEKYSADFRPDQPGGIELWLPLAD